MHWPVQETQPRAGNLAVVNLRSYPSGCTATRWEQCDMSIEPATLRLPFGATPSLVVFKQNDFMVFIQNVVTWACRKIASVILLRGGA